MKHKDILWKGILQDLFEDFLRFIYHNADEIFDFSRGFEFLDKELEQLFPPMGDAGSLRFVDKLVKVYLKDGGEKWMLVHVEVQGYIDSNFAKRMFQYYTRIFDKYEKPITAWAIFTDTNQRYHPKQYEDEVLGTKVTYVFNTYKIIEQDNATLEVSNNPFAMVVLAAKFSVPGKRKANQQLFASALHLAKLLLGKKMSKDKIRSVLHFMNRYINFENTEMIIKFEQEIETLTGGSIAMGIEELIIDIARKEGIERGREEGREKGIEEGKIEKELEKQLSFTHSLLTSTDFDTPKIAQLVGVSEEFVLEVKKESGL